MILALAVTVLFCGYFPVVCCGLHVASYLVFPAWIMYFEDNSTQYATALISCSLIVVPVGKVRFQLSATTHWSARVPHLWGKLKGVPQP